MLIDVNINIVYAFNQVGTRILFIQGRYYIFDQWEAATPTMLKHKLMGARDITDIISTSTQMANRNIDEQALASTIMKFQDIKKRTMEFHGSTEYVLYQ